MTLDCPGVQGMGAMRVAHDREEHAMNNGLQGAVALVTGGAGLIGSHIADALVAAGAREVRVQVERPCRSCGGVPGFDRCRDDAVTQGSA